MQKIILRGLSLIACSLISCPVLAQPSQLVLQSVKVEGSTVFTPTDFASTITPYLNREVTYEDLLELAEKLTQIYQQAGYRTSQIILPEQSLEGGKVTYEAVEGRLVELEINGLSHLQDSYLRERLEAATQPPLSLPKLEEALVLLQQSPLIESIAANFNPGIVAGESSLRVKVVEAPRWQLGIRGDNYDNPQFGDVGATFFASNQNLVGWGDRLDFDYKILEGLNKLFVRYSVPLNAQDGTLQVYYRDDDSRIVEAPLQDVGLTVEGHTFSLGFTQPLWRTPNETFSLGISLDLRSSEAFILESLPYPIYNGSNRLNLSVLRLNQTYLWRSSDTSFAAFSQLSFGLRAFDASPPGELLDPQFFSWQAQLQYAAKLSNDWIFVARLFGQITPDSLPAIEQFPLGGVGSVRGYRQNIRAGDNGLNLSLETPITLFRSPHWGTLSLGPFFEYGVTWNNQLPTVYPNSLASLGVSLEWNLTPSLLLRLDYGVPLIDVPVLNDGSLQDSGVNFLFQFGTTF